MKVLSYGWNDESKHHKLGENLYNHTSGLEPTFRVNNSKLLNRTI